jgi:uncharacterized protein (DUF427 family)
MELDEPSTLPPGAAQVVPGEKWIRGYLNGQLIVDSRQYQFVWDVPYWPWWYFPRAHIQGELLEPVAPRVEELPEGAVRYDLKWAGGTLAGAARAYPNRPGFEDLVMIEFGALDHWFEEDVEVFVHPRSPFTRVDALASSRHVVVSLSGIELANSRKPTVLYETGAPARFYLPMTDVNLELLVENDREGACPYKGEADFFSARVGGDLIEDIAWTYVLPRPEVTPIAGLICFYNERVDIDIDGERQTRPRTHFG